MEHKGKKDDDDILNDFLNESAGEGDFDSFLKEKLKGCTSPTESTILNEQKILPTRGKLPPAESVVEPSTNTSSSNGTGEPEVSSEPSNVEAAAESTSELAPEEKPLAELNPATPTKEELVSDPDYSRQILDGKTATTRTSLTTVRGIKSGPFAKPYSTEENLAGDSVLERLGLPDYAKIWRDGHNFFVRTCEKDVDKLIKHINRLEGAAFRINLMKEAGRDYLKGLLDGMSAEERKRAETLLSKLYKEKADRSKPGVTPAKREKPTGEPKTRTLSATIKKQYDGMIDGLGVTYDQMINLIKGNPPKDVDLVLAYIKQRFNRT